MEGYKNIAAAGQEATAYCGQEATAYCAPTQDDMALVGQLAVYSEGIPPPRASS